MICDELPATGTTLPLVVTVLAVVACLSAGTLLVLRARRPQALTALAILALAAVALAPGLAASPAQAQPTEADCFQTSSGGALTVTQTSVMDGLAPGIPPVAITGLLTNVSTEPTVVAAVDVEITSVTARAGVDGACDASDYQLLDTRMRVDATLDAGAQQPFDGAAIGFLTSDENQDACQGATIHLRYTVVAG